MQDLERHIRDAWIEGVKHEHELVIANVRRTPLHRRDDATLCVCMTCGNSWREDGPYPSIYHSGVAAGS